MTLQFPAGNNGHNNDQSDNSGSSDSDNLSTTEDNGIPAVGSEVPAVKDKPRRK